MQEVGIDEDLLQSIASHEKSIIELIQLLIKGIMVNKIDGKKTAFEEVLHTYSMLSISQKQQTEEYWHCAAAWLYFNDIRSEKIELWLVKWQKFKNQRLGKMPKWMLDLAGKSEISWP